MIPDVVIADSQFLSHFEISDHNGLTIKRAKNKSPLVVSIGNFHPHSFVLTGLFIGKFDFRNQVAFESATVPSTVNTIFPVGVLVSTRSDNETNCTPRELKVSRARGKCEAERANRSKAPDNDHVKTPLVGALHHSIELGRRVLTSVKG
jgi:hypothetical protein